MVAPLDKIPLSPLAINNNGAFLWKFPKGRSVARGHCFEIVGPLWSPTLGRLIFWLKDLLSWGQETKKLHILVIETLEAMQEQMRKPEPHWHFSVSHVGAVPENVTYDMLAEKILDRFPFSQHKLDEIRAEALRIRYQFVQIEHGIEFPLTDYFLIYQKLVNLRFADHDVNGPSFSADQITALTADLKNGLIPDVGFEEFTKLVQQRIKDS